MTDSTAGREEPAQPWWHSTADGVPDLEGLLGEEGMAAVGSVADEALKFFFVMRERFVTPQETQSQQPASAPAGGWEQLFGQLATGAVRMVNDLAAGAVEAGVAAANERPHSGSADPSDPLVQPGDAEACSYCPLCQAIALFRSVPMSTWQRLAASVVEVADAARDAATAATEQAPVVVTPTKPTSGSEPTTVSDLLADLAAPTEPVAPDAPTQAAAGAPAPAAEVVVEEADQAAGDKPEKPADPQ